DRRRPTEPRQPTGFRKPAEPAVPAPRSPEPAPDTVGGLPRRVRQASLAPQLREGPDSRAAGPDPVGGAEDIERDAEEVRSRMASLQRGWQRGRRQNAEDVTGHGDTAQGITPGGDGP
ncbi:histidine kinase, partial [Streptomyces sp. A0958]